MPLELIAQKAKTARKLVRKSWWFFCYKLLLIAPPGYSYPWMWDGADNWVHRNVGKRS